MRWPSLICHKKFSDLCWSFVAFQWLQSQDKIVFLSLINSERGNKSSKKIPLRAPVTERMSRAQSSLELFYSSLFQLFNRYTDTKFMYCQERGTGWRRVHHGESARGSKRRHTECLGAPAPRGSPRPVVLGCQAARPYFVKFSNVEARTTAWKHMEDTAELHNITLRGAIKRAREVGLSTFLAMITKGWW